MRGNSHVRCGVGENSEITSKNYLSLFKRIWIAWVIINGIGAFIAYITPLFDGYATLPGSTGSLPSGGGSAPAFIPDTGGSSSGGTGGGTAVSVSFLKYFT